MKSLNEIELETISISTCVLEEVKWIFLISFSQKISQKFINTLLVFFASLRRNFDRIII